MTTKISILVAALFVSAWMTEAQNVLYVANHESTGASVFIIDPATGALTSQGAAPSQGTPQPAGSGLDFKGIAVDPSQRFVYVTDYSSNSVAAYTINHSNGTLAPLGATSTGINPMDIAIDPSGKFAYVANVNSSNISAYHIDSSAGTLTQLGGSPVDAKYRIVGITVDPSGSFLYTTDFSNDTVSVFSVAKGQSSGALDTNGQNPWSVAIDPLGPYAFVTDSDGVSAYKIDPKTGALDQLPHYLPVDSSWEPRGIAVLSGKFVLAVSGGVFVYKIDPSTGVLTEIPGSPFTAGRQPYGIALDPLGHFVYVSNTSDGTVSAYAMDPNTGALTAIAGSPFPAGVGPYGLAIAHLAP